MISPALSSNVIDFIWSLTNHRLPDPKEKVRTCEQGGRDVPQILGGWLTGKKCDAPNLVCQGVGENYRIGYELRGK